MISVLQRWLVSILLIGSTISAYSQIENPVEWSFSTKDLGNGKYEIISHASVDAGWHMYSQFTPEGGPLPTSFTYESKENISLNGNVKESGKVKKYLDDIFEVDVISFDKDASFTQLLTVTAENGKLEGYVTYMVCNDEKCLPPKDVEFSFDLKGVTKVESPQPESPANPEKKDKKDIRSDKAETPTPKVDEQPKEMGQFSPQEGIINPVSWSFSHKKTGEGEYELVCKGTIDEGWKIYAPNTPSGGPIRTSVEFENSPVQKVRGLRPDHPPKSEMDDVFGVEVRSFTKEVTLYQTIQAKEAGVVKGYLTFMACDNNRCLAPKDVDFSIDLSKEGGAISSDAGTAAVNIFQTEDGANPFKRQTIDRTNPVSGCIQEAEYNNIWSLLLQGIFWGIFALLTPCIFPMIPLTVSFFTKSSSNRREGIFNGVIYGLSILLIYTLVSLPFHLIPGLDSNIFNVIATDPILNIVFFTIFVVFAFSFFGFFEITLPSAVADQAGKGRSARGFIGIFFMALTLTIVSFSCTGPLFGNVFAMSAQNFVSPWSVTAAAAGFGIALGLPFAIFAAFPGLLNSLPKSGGWLSTTKVVLGFVEIALALKFLSNADLVEHWGLLKREIFIGIWIAVGILLAAYLLGMIKFPHDDIPKPLPKGRIALSLATLGFVAYLVPGFWTTRPLISGFLPPMYYSIFEKKTECPHDLDCFKDYEEGLAYAKSVNKPIMIDFTGFACVNCRDMEENVWPKEDVMKIISQDYVLISLYTDDRKKLETPMVIPDGNGGEKKLRTVGSKWAEFQEVNFLSGSQPFYVLMSPDEVLLNTPVGYTPDVQEYQNFLECGLQAFQGLAVK